MWREELRMLKIEDELQTAAITKADDQARGNGISFTTRQDTPDHVEKYAFLYQDWVRVGKNSKGTELYI